MHSFDNIKSMLANAYLLTLVLTHTHKYASCVFIQKYVHAWGHSEFVKVRLIVEQQVPF